NWDPYICEINERVLKIRITDAHIGFPTIPEKNIFASEKKLYPSECRLAGSNYSSNMTISYEILIDDEILLQEKHLVGKIPIMVQSCKCNLNGLNNDQLISSNEEPNEVGGYFIINGNEKVIRLLIMPRRNYPISHIRTSWLKRGSLYSKYGVSMRCVKDDETSSNMILHYLNNGTAQLCIFFEKKMFFIPVVLIIKALSNKSDKEICQTLLKGIQDSELRSYYRWCIIYMLRQVHAQKIHNQQSALEYLGVHFKFKLNLLKRNLNPEAGEYLIRKCVAIHLTNNEEKFNLLCFMVRKLFVFINGKCANENPDNIMFQEVLTPGRLYMMFLREKLVNWCQSIHFYLNKKEKKETSFMFNQANLRESVRRSLNLTKSFEYLLATGNLQAKSNLALMQSSGLTVVADKLNYYRYISHFRSIHRGSYFTGGRTVGVRKLLAECWGFICPVHTPDGAPCGLLNHLSLNCSITPKTQSTELLTSRMFKWGMIAVNESFDSYSQFYYPVMINGRLVGWFAEKLGVKIEKHLRELKCYNSDIISSDAEICLVEPSDLATQYPGFFIFTETSRFIRTVKNVKYDCFEYIGSFEQVYLKVAMKETDNFSHVELSKTSFLSFNASLIPFSDYNQSPRNIYQCQMGKQTMGQFALSIPYRSDFKSYRLISPQSPMTKPIIHDEYELNNYPMGTNAVIAVISYTGYDMEDAMIINKSSWERGFAHACVYKNEKINLNTLKGRNAKSIIFSSNTSSRTIDKDGLPMVGCKLHRGDGYYSYFDTGTNEFTVVNYKKDEIANVEQVTIVGDDDSNGPLSHILVRLRIERNPIVGDKFSSRHGQKGICSKFWPLQDMPFSVNGITPDILFNPHGFPSRMTIGMMIETMASKSAALKGVVSYDATSFQFSEKKTAIDYFAKKLVHSGYCYYGTEEMYSGVTGTKFDVDIFTGIVYYQRLRHMISDKFQVRGTGTVNTLTRQPVKGRKRGGGIRIGEMERDAILSHGMSYFLHDRLLNCSDKSISYICLKCGSTVVSDKKCKITGNRKQKCRRCNSSSSIESIYLPYVFRYLIAELVAVNIKISIQLKSI
ncbi:RNA polymerase I subunit 2, partial [Intoshia linei]